MSLSDGLFNTIGQGIALAVRGEVVAFSDSNKGVRTAATRSMAKKASIKWEQDMFNYRVSRAFLGKNPKDVFVGTEPVKFRLTMASGMVQVPVPNKETIKGSKKFTELVDTARQCGFQLTGLTTLYADSYNPSRVFLKFEPSTRPVEATHG